MYVCMYVCMYVPTMLSFLNTFFSNKTYSLIKMAICSVEHRYTCTQILVYDHEHKVPTYTV